MIDPLSLFPLAVAAHGGMIDDYPAQQLVAAGLATLQRSAPLVRALSGKRGAILLPTSPAFFVALAACEGRGAVLVNPLASAHEIAHQLRDANVGAVFTNAALAPLLPDGTAHVLLDDAPRSALAIVSGAQKRIDLGSHLGLSLEGDPDVEGSPEEAVVVYTSAMAGRPLGAVLTHRNLIANARSTVTAAQQSRDDRVLALLPFAHLFGLTVTAGSPLLSGARVVTMAKFSPARAAELIVSGEITEVVGVPGVFRALLAALRKRGGATTNRLRLCICGGSPLSTELQERWADETHAELRQGYGLTEAGPVCLFNRTDRPNERGTLGSPFPGVEVALRAPIGYDADGRPEPAPHVSQGNVREICVRGVNVSPGYVSNGDAGLPRRDGWLHTGDLGREGPNGTIGFAGIVKPMFTRNGFNIYPREIELAVRELAGVERATVREIAVDNGESEIEIEVTGAVTADDVGRWCATRLSGYKRPSVIRIAG